MDSQGKRERNLTPSVTEQCCWKRQRGSVEVNLACEQVRGRGRGSLEGGDGATDRGQEERRRRRLGRKENDSLTQESPAVVVFYKDLIYLIYRESKQERDRHREDTSRGSGGQRERETPR